MSFYKTLVISITLLSPALIFAQEAVVTAGNDFTNNSGSLSYSLGQVFYTTNTGSDGTVSEGVQQAYEIFTLKVEDHRLKPSMTVYPNPTEDIVNLRIANLNSDKLSYMLFDGSIPKSV